MKQLLRNISYMKLFLASAISRFGDSIDMIAYGYMVYELTGSKLLLATTYIVNVVPNIAFSSFSGTLVDFFSKKRIMVVGDCLRGLVVAITALLFMNGMLLTWHIFVFTFINSTIETFVAPCKYTAKVLLVNKEDLPIINSTMESIIKLVELAGLGMAGVIIGLGGTGSALLVDAVTFIVSGIIISSIAFPEQEAKQLTRNSFFSSYKEGFSYILTHRAFLWLALCATALNFLVTPINALSAAYVDEILEAGALGLSLLSIAQVSGMILGGFILGKLNKHLSLSTMTFIGLVVTGLGFLGLGLPHYFSSGKLAIGVTSMFILGFFIIFSNAGLNTFFMTYINKDVLARVNAIMSMLSMSANPLGAFASGIIATTFGLTPLFIGFGIIFILIAFLPQRIMKHPPKTDDNIVLSEVTVH